MTCCSDFFTDFTFADIRQATPPSSKGVYVIRVAHRGASADDIIRSIAPLLSTLNWSPVEKKINNRIARLKRIDDCPIIYIGSAGTDERSKYTLRGRYGDFADRHTIMYPLWCLLYFGWQLEYGYRAIDTPSALEAELKTRFQERHGRLPALVHH